MPFNIGPGELILILVIALVVLGPGKLPDVAQSLGRSLREFRKAASDVTDAARVDTPAPTPPATTAAPAPNTLASSTQPNTLSSNAGAPVAPEAPATPDSNAS